MAAAAAAEALKKWDNGRAPRIPRKIFENINANMCNLVHFGVKKYAL